MSYTEVKVSNEFIKLRTEDMRFDKPIVDRLLPRMREIIEQTVLFLLTTTITKTKTPFSKALCLLIILSKL